MQASRLTNTTRLLHPLIACQQALGLEMISWLTTLVAAG